MELVKYHALYMQEQLLFIFVVVIVSMIMFMVKV